jgi:hypothetical protein
MNAHRQTLGLLCCDDESARQQYKRHQVPLEGVTGASILCYAVAPHTGQLFFLLGKESGGAADARLDYDVGATRAGSWPLLPALAPLAKDDDAGGAASTKAAGRAAVTHRQGLTLDDGITLISEHGAQESLCCDVAHREPTKDCTRHDDGQRQHLPPSSPPLPPSSPSTLSEPHALCAEPGPGAIRRTRRTHRWCDFGGRIEPGETIEEAAAREFFEETLGLVCTDSCRRSAHRDAAMGSVDVGARPGTHGVDDRRALAADLAAGRYALRVCTCLNHGAAENVPRRYHVTFVKRIPWTPSVVLQFARLRSELAAVARTRRHQQSSACINVAGNDASITAAAAVAIDGAQCGTTGDGLTSTPCDAMGRRLAVNNRGATMAADNADRRSYRAGGVQGSHNDQRRRHHSDTSDARNAEDRDVAYECFAECYDSDEPAARAAIDSDGRVRDEYIEKDYLQFWSVRRLRQALDNGGCFRREHLRPLFLPTMAVALDIMAPRDSGQSRDWHARGRVVVDRTNADGLYTVRCNALGRRHHHHSHERERQPFCCDHQPFAGTKEGANDKSLESQRPPDNHANAGEPGAPSDAPSPIDGEYLLLFSDDSSLSDDSNPSADEPPVAF